MRILMLAHRIPYPPHTGDRVRAFHVARHLAKRHELLLAFPIDDRADWSGIDPLREEFGRMEFAGLWRPWGMLKGCVGLVTGRPITLCCFSSYRLRERLSRRLREEAYDLIYVSSGAMAQYVEDARSIPVVMDFVDVDSDKWIQYAERTLPPLAWVYRAEGRRLREYEASVARWARLCVLATGVEETLLRSFAPWANTAVVSNGVDLEHLSPEKRAIDEPILIFTGAMDYLPNIDAVEYFCTDIFPRVRKAIPESRFFIVGQNPAPSVLRLSKIPGVTVTGPVPDVRPFYGRAAVCVAPLRIARGVQNKILQAMAMGLPVIATHRACQGIEAQPGKDLLIADDSEAFAEKTVELLRKPETRAALGQRARSFVEARHSWDASLAKLEDLLHSIIIREGNYEFLGSSDR
jgi:sugar transferase (PEP-CTERM/EpsH1 system associated)